MVATARGRRYDALPIRCESRPRTELFAFGWCEIGASVTISREDTAAVERSRPNTADRIGVSLVPVRFSKQGILSCSTSAHSAQAPRRQLSSGSPVPGCQAGSGSGPGARNGTPIRDRIVNPSNQ
ncbi:hypothetical protein MSTO_25940 [Mycobacterium stomatepiae]|uniref:Uncharacterized protein n=1 Tax=Mycobacterium stomatepiae TaxID=470076 RepID=A0A7I7Q7Y2_9MYCO|nr:hypothetical protein MSTO_25940 [Mycobacterium stomatepiae]